MERDGVRARPDGRTGGDVVTPARLAEIRRMRPDAANLDPDWHDAFVELLAEFDHVVRSNEWLAASVTRLEAEVERLTPRLRMPHCPECANGALSGLTCPHCFPRSTP